MNSPSPRRLEYDRENALYELFASSNDVAIIESNQRNDASWLMALGRYLKTVRVNSHPISSHPSLYPFLGKMLKDDLPFTRGLLLILKQCVYLYPDQLIDLSFQRHLSAALPILTDPYLKYKYTRLLRLIVDEIDQQFLHGILPSNDHLLDHYHRLDPSAIIVLEKLVLIHSDAQLQSRLNELYPSTLLGYLKSHDFDDDELIDLCQVLFQINLNKSLHCTFTIPVLFIDLLSYIDYETDTMMNWLLTPETGEKFLVFTLRLVKYLASNRDQLPSQVDNDNCRQAVQAMKRFHEQLKNAHEKSLFPYNIRPLLNAFNLF